MSRSAASDETLDAWLALPESDLRTIEEFAEEADEPKAPKRPSVVPAATRVSTNVYDPWPPQREAATARLHEALAHCHGKAIEFQVLPEMYEELEIEARTDIRHGGHPRTEDGTFIFRGIPIRKRLIDGGPEVLVHIA